jgi:putative ABC transport system permease protein
MTSWSTLRVATRAWRRTPALAAIIILTLALGIGSTTTAFTLAYSVLVRTLPFPEPGELFWIVTYNTRETGDGTEVLSTNRLPQFIDWQTNVRSFAQLGAWAGGAPDAFTVTGAGTPGRVSGLRVTQGLFPMLGAQPAAGALFRRGDDAFEAPQTVVLSHGYWQRRFGGRRDVIGQSLIIDNVQHSVIGVLSADAPLEGTLFGGTPIDLYLPLELQPDEDIGGFMAVIGRLRPGATIEQARGELAARQAALVAGQWKTFQDLAQRVTPLPDPVVRTARVPVLLLLSGVGCVLLMACANLANLLLVRASGRRREMHVRAALGATMRQLFGQTLAESGILVVAGGLAGVAFTAMLVGALRGAPWLELPRVGELRVEWPSIAFTFLVCAITTLVCGSLPLLHVRRRDAIDALRPHGGGTTDRRAAVVQRLTLTAQVAFALVLTVAGGLLLRSFAGLLDVDPGFEPRGALAMRVDPAGRLPNPAKLPFFNQVIERVRDVSGIDAAALTIHVPMGDRPSIGLDVVPVGEPPNPTLDNAAGRIVSPGYFDTIGIRLLSGRDFNARDVRPNPLVLAINDTLARRLRAEGRDPLAARFRVLGAERQVVAVVSDVKHRGLDGDAGREVYIPMAQAPPFFDSYDLVVRAADPIALLPAIRDAIWSIDRNQALGTPVMLEEYIGRSLWPRRLLTLVISSFAAAALLLAALGVYGVVGYRVAQRMKEIAIRVALGAPRWRITTTVLRDTLAFVALGFAAGIPLALGAGMAVQRYLFGIEPRDLPTLAAAGLVVVAAALLAAYVPARRAPRVDPIAALRAD